MTSYRTRLLAAFHALAWTRLEPFQGWEVWVDPAAPKRKWYLASNGNLRAGRTLATSLSYSHIIATLLFQAEQLVADREAIQEQALKECD